MLFFLHHKESLQMGTYMMSFYGTLLGLKSLKEMNTLFPIFVCIEFSLLGLGSDGCRRIVIKAEAVTTALMGQFTLRFVVSWRIRSLFKSSIYFNLVGDFNEERYTVLILMPVCWQMVLKKVYTFLVSLVQ